MSDLDGKIASLRFDFETERAHKTAQAMPLESTPVGTCRYCGKHRWQYPSTKIDGHGMCLVGPEFRQRMVAVMQDPKITFAGVGELFGLNHSIIRQWYRAAEKGK